MSERQHTLSGTAPWLDLATAPMITAADADEALTAMEIGHIHLLDRQPPVARRLIECADEMGRADLRRRAQLVLANATLRLGDPVESSAIARHVLAEAQEEFDDFACARAHFVLAWIGHTVGDLADAQINGIRSVEMLPEGVASSIVADHLVIVAIAYDPAPESARYFEEALEITRQQGDPIRIKAVHNNIAFAALRRGALPLATYHANEMLRLAERAGVTPPAIELDTIARVYNASGRFDDAISLLAPLYRAMTMTPSEAHALVDSQSHGLVLGLTALASACRGAGDLDTAQEVLTHAAAMAADANMGLASAEILEEQSHLSAARGEYEQAYTQYVAFHEALMSLQSRDADDRALIVQASFDAERNRKQAQHYRELAMRDALTGLYNRRYMDELLASEIAACEAADEPLSVAIIDVDHFKKVNDEYSHDVGDAVLRTLAVLLLDTRPESCTVCRLGGEEFVVVMPQVDADAAMQACESLRSSVAAHRWPMLSDSARLTISIGVTTNRGPMSVSSLLSDADRNLYAAKRSGRNRVLAGPR